MKKIRSLYYSLLIEITSEDFKPFDYKDMQFLMGAGFFALYIIIQLFISSFDINTVFKTGLSSIILLVVFGIFLEPQKKMDSEKTKTVLLMTPLMSLAILFVGNLLIINMSNSGVEAYSTELNKLPLSLKYLSVFVYAPIIEEIIFRGVIYRRFRTALNSVLFGALASSILFFIGHGTVGHLFPSLFFGVFLCMIYEYTGNIYINIVCHFIYNFLAFITGSIVYTNSIGSFIFSILCNFVIVSILSILYMATTRKNYLLPNQKLF